MKLLIVVAISLFLVAAFAEEAKPESKLKNKEKKDPIKSEKKTETYKQEKRGLNDFGYGQQGFSAIGSYGHNFGSGLENQGYQNYRNQDLHGTQGLLFIGPQESQGFGGHFLDNFAGVNSQEINGQHKIESGPISFGKQNEEHGSTGYDQRYGDQGTQIIKNNEPLINVYLNSQGFGGQGFQEDIGQQKFGFVDQSYQKNSVQGSQRLEGSERPNNFEYYGQNINGDGEKGYGYQGIDVFGQHGFGDQFNGAQKSGHDFDNNVQGFPGIKGLGEIGIEGQNIYSYGAIQNQKSQYFGSLNSNLNNVGPQVFTNQGSQGNQDVKGIQAFGGEDSGMIKIITKTIQVPHPYPVHIERKVPYPVSVPVDRPYPVEVPKPYPVAVEKLVPYKVDNPIPYPVKVPVHIPVYHRIEVPVPKPYPVPVEKPYPVHVSQPYIVEKKIPVYIQEHSSYGFGDQVSGSSGNGVGYGSTSDYKSGSETGFGIGSSSGFESSSRSGLDHGLNSGAGFQMGYGFKEEYENRGYGGGQGTFVSSSGVSSQGPKNSEDDSNLLSSRLQSGGKSSMRYTSQRGGEQKISSTYHGKH